MPQDALLGDLHEGWRVAMAVLEDERGSFGAAGAISVKQQLSGFGPRLNDSDPVQRDRFAGLRTQGMALGQLLSRFDGDSRMPPVAKVLHTEMDSAATEVELMSLGAAGMLDSKLDPDVVARFLYSPGMRIAGGSSEIQRNIIGERLLDLPREPR